MNRILELLRQKNIDFKDTGGDILIHCLNPEHEDNHPSLRVDRETGVFHCLSCGFGKGIPSIFHYFNEGMFRQSPRLIQVRKRITEILRSTQTLVIPDSARLYDSDFRGISAATLKKYFAFQHEEDWEGRIVFPITDSVGRIVVFLGRTLNGKASPKYMLKPKDIPAPLFPQRYNEQVIIMTEGIFDMLNLEDKGLTNSIACFGTHQFSMDNTADKLAPYILSGTKAIVILLDNDTSGNAAAEKVARMIRDKTRLAPIIANHLLPKDKDPGELDAEEVAELAKNIEILVAETLNPDV